MTMKFRIIINIILFVLLTSCNSNKIVVGKYRSNFAEMGFFITKIELKPDNTFHYEFSGDLQHTELDGIYRIEKNDLYLRFNKLKGETEKDAIKIVKNDTIVDFEKLSNSHSYELKKDKKIEYHLKYRRSNGKLFVYNIQTNKIVRKAKKYSDKRKYILFGPKYYYKKMYLKKVEK